MSGIEQQGFPANRSGICGRHEELVRDIACVIQATTDLRDGLKEHKRDIDRNITALTRAINGLVRANGLKGERLATVEVKVGWLAGIIGAVAGASVNLILWFWRGHGQ